MSKNESSDTGETHLCLNISYGDDADGRDVAQTCLLISF